MRPGVVLEGGKQVCTCTESGLRSAARGGTGWRAHCVHETLRGCDCTCEEEAPSLGSCLSAAGRVTGLGPGGLRPSLSDDGPPTPSLSSRLGQNLGSGPTRSCHPRGRAERYKPVLIRQVWGWDGAAVARPGPPLSSWDHRDPGGHVPLVSEPACPQHMDRQL